MTAKYYLEEIFGESLNDSDFLNKAYMSQDIIRYLNTTPYSYETTIKDFSMDIYLPANVKHINAVVQGVGLLEESDGLKTLRYSENQLYVQRGFLEQFTKKVGSRAPEFWRTNAQPGFEYINYENMGDHIHITDNLPVGTKVSISYEGLIVGEDNLPLITNLQAMAISHWIERLLLMKGIKRKDKGASELIGLVQADTDRYIIAASMPETLTDGELDTILEAVSSFDRKLPGRPMKFTK